MTIPGIGLALSCRNRCCRRIRQFGVSILLRIARRENPIFFGANGPRHAFLHMIGVVKLRADQRILGPVPVDENMFHCRSRNRYEAGTFPGGMSEIN